MSLIIAVFKEPSDTQLPTMKTFILFCTLAVSALAAHAGESYNPAYDSFNAQELVENPRLLNNYGNCFLSKGPCTAEGHDFKKTIPEALRTNCAKCTPKQRQLVRIVCKGFQEKLPEVWEQLVQQEDPKGIYKESFNKFLNSSD